MCVEADERTPAGLDQASDPLAPRRAGTSLAGLALAAIDFPFVLEEAELAVGLDVVAQAGTARGDGIGQGLLDRGDEASGAGAAGGVAREAERGEAGAEEGLADVDVAQAGDQPLVEQGSFERGSAALQRV